MSSTTRIRGRWTFSLRTMLIVVTLVGVALTADENFDSHRRAIAAIESRGGLVGYDIQTKASPPIAWLRTYLPWCYFYRVRMIDLSKTQINDSDLQILLRFESLQKLTVEETTITDEGLIHIGKLKNLRILELNKTLITNEGLKHLNDLHALEVLKVRHTGVTKEAIQRFNAVHPGCACSR